MRPTLPAAPLSPLKFGPVPVQHSNRDRLPAAPAHPYECQTRCCNTPAMMNNGSKLPEKIRFMKVQRQEGLLSNTKGIGGAQEASRTYSRVIYSVKRR